MVVIINPTRDQKLLDEFFETVSYTEEEEWGDELPDDGEPDDIESKTIRYVRTAAGAERYGQPIGTPIIADQNGNPIKYRMPEAVLAIKEPDPTWLSGQGVGLSSHHRTEIGPYTVKVYDPGGGNRVNWSVNFIAPSGQAGFEIDSGTSKDRETAKAAGVRAARKRRDEYQYRPKEREIENAFDYWAGVPGYDYWPEGQEVTQVDIDKYGDDPDYRYGLALRTAHANGYKVTTNSSEYEMDVNVLETMNTLMDVHNQMFPGFTQTLVSEIGLDSHGEAIAFNATDFKYEGGTFTTKTKIMLSPRYFSDRDDAYDQMDHMGKRPRGWWFTDSDELDAAYGEYFDVWQLRMLGSATHEIGHTFARIGFGEIRVNGYPMGPARDYFYEGLHNTLYNWGILKNEEMDQQGFNFAVQENIRAQSAQMAAFDTDVMREVLSSYGAASLHEMCAEAWAEYMLDPNPRAFAVEIGTLLADTMEVFMESKES